MSIADLPIADQLAHAGGRKVRRHVNESIYRTAREAGGDAGTSRRFVCECGHLDCPELVVLRLSEFDLGSRPGTILARHERQAPA
jgi:hypothetical protein